MVNLCRLLQDANTSESGTRGVIEAHDDVSQQVSQSFFYNSRITQGVMAEIFRWFSWQACTRRGRKGDIKNPYKGLSGAPAKKIKLPLPCAGGQTCCLVHVAPRGWRRVSLGQPYQTGAMKIPVYLF